MSHTFNVFLAAVSFGVRRVVLASSNHVMGGYKDDPAAGSLTPETSGVSSGAARRPNATEGGPPQSGASNQELLDANAQIQTHTQAPVAACGNAPAPGPAATSARREELRELKEAEEGHGQSGPAPSRSTPFDDKRSRQRDAGLDA